MPDKTTSKKKWRPRAPQAESTIADEHLDPEREANPERIAGEDPVQIADVEESCAAVEVGANDGDGEADSDDSVKMLEALMMKIGLNGQAEYEELSQEQIQSNEQRQEDEMLALEAIYGDNVVISRKKDGLRALKIYVDYEVPDGINVAAKVQHVTTSKVDNHGEPKGFSGSEELLCSFSVQFLPPFYLACLLPKTYPSHHPPYFTVTVQWLDQLKVSSLCRALDHIWSEQVGQEVIFTWVQWLQTSSLSSLGFDEGILLSLNDVPDPDCRAISHNLSPEFIVPLMMNYNDGKRHEAFLNNFHLCVICYSEYKGSNFAKLPCQHYFCFNCLESYSRIHVKEGTINKLICPDAKCSNVIPPPLLQKLLGHENYERWESLLLSKTLDSMRDVVYCPRCETACIEDNDNDAQCSKCYFCFCTLCYGRRHVGQKCMDPEEKLSYLKSIAEKGRSKDEVHKVRQQINEMLNIREIIRDSKQCPSCKMAISRTEGCNKMVCGNCGQYFCYRCNQPIDGYDHFRGGCELFPREEMARWEMMMNPRQVVVQAQNELFGRSAQDHPCPVCRQPNVKVGKNNHLFCWACQTHYCALCRQTVRKSSQHYGPKGCRQHTDT